MNANSTVRKTRGSPTLPRNSSGVIAANTNWKYASVLSENRNFGIAPSSSGMTA